MNTTVTPKLNFFRHGNDLKNWNANCWSCQIILMQMEQMLKEIEFIIENREKKNLKISQLIRCQLGIAEKSKILLTPHFR